jgi:hypothetical protein
MVSDGGDHVEEKPMNWRQMLPELPLWMWLAVAAIPVTGVGLMILVYLWAFRVEARMDAERKAIFDAYFAARGSRCSDDDPDRQRVEAALVDLRGGGSFDIYWVAAANGGTLFEYRTGAKLLKHGFGYLERSPLPGLEETLQIFPRTKLTLEHDPIFDLGREVGEGWTNPEFHKRFGVVASDAAVASRVVTSRLQWLLLELPEVSRLDRELIEIAVNKNYLAVLGRKGDWRAKRGDKLPDLENHLRLSIHIRDALGR